MVGSLGRVGREEVDQVLDGPGIVPLRDLFGRLIAKTKATPLAI